MLGADAYVTKPLPLGFFMVAQGVLIALVLVGLISARWQDRGDKRRAADV